MTLMENTLTSLGAFMKWSAGAALGASLFLGACATSAMGDEVFVSSGGEEETRIRMVIDEIHDGEERTRMCVFVPAGGDEAAGAISCSGADFRVVEFGDDGNVFFNGDTVISESEITRMVEERLVEFSERMAERGELHIEFQEMHLESQAFAEEMAELGREMEELHVELTLESEEERAELEAELQELAREMEALNRQGFAADSEEMREQREEMEELRAEMAELAMDQQNIQRELWFENREEMAELQAEMAIVRAEAMAEVAEEMARLEADGIFVRARDGEHAWVSELGESMSFLRELVIDDVDGDVVIVERLSGEDGGPRIIIRTTDPSLVEVIQIDRGDMEFHEDD